jgi:hypothetical protein
VARRRGWALSASAPLIAQEHEVRPNAAPRDHPRCFQRATVTCPRCDEGGDRWRSVRHEHAHATLRWRAQ